MRYFTVLLLLLCIQVRSQTLQGVVTDGATGKPMYMVTVVNRLTKVGAFTNESGVYVIAANPGDVIAFSYVGYKTAERIKQQSVLIATQNIVMEEAEYSLKEFVLHPGLTHYQVDSIERAAIYKLPLQRRPPNPVMSPASAIAEQFSKKAKRNYAFQKVFAAGETEKFIDTRYNPALVTKITGLTGDSIGHFMYAYPMPYDFARTATDLELKMWVRSSYKEWTKSAESAERGERERGAER